MAGTGSYTAGIVSESAGTVLSLSLLTDGWTFDPARKVSFHAGLRPGEIVLFNGVDSGGVSLEWFRREGLDGMGYDDLEAQLRAYTSDRRAPMFLPYLTGVNPPDYFPDARGAFLDLDLAHGRIDLAYAVEEGVAHLLRRNVDYLTAGPAREIISTGGGASSAFWNQLKADVCGIDVVVPDEREATCRGAAALALVAAGEIADLPTPSCSTHRDGSLPPPLVDRALRAVRPLRDVPHPTVHHRPRKPTMMLAVSSPMIPADSLTAKAELLKRWGYEPSACFSRWRTGTTGSVVSSVAGERTAYAGRVRPDRRHLRPRHGPGPGPAGALPRDVLDAASVCAELGTVTEIEYEYGARNPLPVFHPFRKLDAGQKDQFLDFYREMLAVVAGTEGRVLLEPINRYECRYLNLVSDNLEIIEAVDHPNAGLLPDTFHMSIEEVDVASSIRAARDRVAQSTSETTTGSCRVTAASTGRRSSARSKRSDSRAP